MLLMMLQNVFCEWFIIPTQMRFQQILNECLGNETQIIGCFKYEYEFYMSLVAYTINLVILSNPNEIKLSTSSQLQLKWTQ